MMSTFPEFNDLFYLLMEWLYRLSTTKPLMVVLEYLPVEKKRVDIPDRECVAVHPGTPMPKP